MKALAQLALAIALILVGSNARAVETASAPGQSADFTHRASGFVFPPTVGRFQRVSQNEFGSGGNDVGVGYDLTAPDAEMTVTVFVSRAVQLTGLTGDKLRQAEDKVCESAFESRQQNLKQVHAGAGLVSQAEIPSPSASHDRKGRQAIYEFQSQYRGRPMLVRSESDVFCFVNGGWMVAYRITAPANIDYRAEFDQFMRQLVWPTPDTSRDAAPRPPSKLIFVQRKIDARPMILAGVIIRGSAKEINRFERETTSRGIEMGRRGGSSKTEAMIMFLAQDLDRKSTLDFYHQAKSGGFGAIKLSVIALLPERLGTVGAAASTSLMVAPEDVEVPAD